MTKRQARPPTLSDWQRTAVAELRALAIAHPSDLHIVGQSTITDLGHVGVRIRLNTADLTPVKNGLPLLTEEEFVVSIRPSMLTPPLVDVDHVRFLGYPHVLQGQRLCVYLDPAREWDPKRGLGGWLDDLYNWLRQAAAGQFDADTALYHAVGGVLHPRPGTPTIVVRQSRQNRLVQIASLVTRTEQRLDLDYDRTSNGDERVPVISLASDLPLGAGTTLRELVLLLDNPDLGLGTRRATVQRPQSPAFLTALAASAARKPPDSPQYLVLQVPHPVGGPPHLLAARLAADGANELRRMVAERTTPTIDIDARSIDPELALEWCAVSDEREEVTTRRDTGRPVNGFAGKTVHVWGCGGLGSWAAEFVARAGAARVVLCDPGTIMGGLLVRQNYVEADVGDSKAEALARRLRAISDGLEVEVQPGLMPEDVANMMATAHVIIDATVNLAIGQVLEALATSDTRRPVIAQLATDARSGTLGILTVSAPPHALGPNTIDEQVGKAVRRDGSLEIYHRLWEEPADGDELIPTRGCSVPTFHGSAADLAAVAASLITLLGAHLDVAASGMHLISLPHGDAGPRHHFCRLE